MDSVSQFVLGSSIAYAALGKPLGRKAALYGGIIATLPDLDVFVHAAGSIAAMVEHRSITHSIFTHISAAACIGWLLTRIHRTITMQRAFWTVYALFVTHALLDTFTVYGTQIFWPISTFPYSLDAVFIVDPLYTVWLLAATLCAVCFGYRRRIYTINTVALTVSTAYLLLALTMHAVMVRTFYAEHSNDFDRVLIQPMPTTTFLWRALAFRNDAYYESIASVFDTAPFAEIYTTPHNHHLRAEDEPADIQRLIRFSKGFYRLRADNAGNVQYNDLRFGFFDTYTYGAFDLARTPPVLIRTAARSDGMLTRIWQRIFDESVSLHDNRPSLQ